MKLIVAFLCLFMALVNCLPAVSPVEGSDFDFDSNLESQINTFVESNFDGKALELYHEVVNAYKSYSESQEDKKLIKRDSALEAQLEAAILMVNNSGIIWDILDAVADNPTRIQSLSNLTTTFLKNQNISISVSSLLLSSSSLSSKVNLTGLITAVEQSGLVTSILDGILLDTNFRPHLVELIYSVVWSQRDILLYLFAMLQKRDGMIVEDDLYELLGKRADDNSGSLLAFANNAIGTILSSPLVASVTADFLNALNDTGVAVYTIQRFLSTESYLNMTGYLIKNILSSSSVQISTGGLNLTSLVDIALSNPKQVASLVGSLLDGDTSQFLGYLGKYASAVGSIIKDLEKTGLFAQLNSYIFGDEITTTTAAAASTSGSNNDRKDILTTSGSGNSTASATTRESSTATNAAASVSNFFTSSDSNTSVLKALVAIIGGALFTL